MYHLYFAHVHDDWLIFENGIHVVIKDDRVIKYVQRFFMKLIILMKSLCLCFINVMYRFMRKLYDVREHKGYESIKVKSVKFGFAFHDDNYVLQIKSGELSALFIFELETGEIISVSAAGI